MTDREMLELAAKAGGYARHEYVENSARDGRVVTGHYDSLLEVCINPLTDDGDALRLAVTLNMGISIPVWKDNRIDVITFRDSRVNVIEKGNDAMAATRRAIVRAAAMTAAQTAKE